MKLVGNKKLRSNSKQTVFVDAKRNPEKVEWTLQENNDTNEK